MSEKAVRGLAFVAVSKVHALKVIVCWTCLQATVIGIGENRSHDASFNLSDVFET